ncbi:MAG: class I SAM-dependent methyltransferase [Nostoc sp.]
MFDSNNPEINIDELMQKIHEEVAKRPGSSQPLATKNNADIDITSLMSKINSIEALLVNAESRASVRTKWPDKLNRFPFNFSSKFQKIILKLINFFFKDQREVNFNLILALKASVTVNEQLIEQINTLKTQINECLSTVDTHFQDIDQYLGVMDIRLQGIDDSLNTINGSVNNSITDIEEKLNNFKTHIQRMDERHIRNDNYLKNDLIQQKRIIALFLEEARRRLPEPFNQQQVQNFINEDQHLLDAFYVAFEDQFRGSREQIGNRLKVYLPLIEEAKVGTPNSPILDVGCGRGEWLELLRESGYTAKGIDMNRVMQEQCQARKLDVLESDVIAYLQSLPDDSLGAVTGFHIIEHLEFPVLIKLLEEVVRVLKTEGIAIFETPNPKNLVVGACNFYSDPTHRNPVFPETIQFCLSFKGLSNVQLMYLNPVEDSPFDKPDIESLTLNNWFFGSRDYAVIGYKK